MKCFLLCSLASLLAISACSSTAPTVDEVSQDSSSPTEVEGSLSAPTEPAVVAPTATAAPPTPVPTPVPAPDPIFTWVDMPAGMASTAESSGVEVLSPSGGFGWLIVGHQYDSTTDELFPQVWDASDGGSFVAEGLPLAEASRFSAGQAFTAAVIAGRQVVGGKQVGPAGSVPAIWSRSSPEEAWSVHLFDEYFVPDSNHARVTKIVSSEGLALMQLAVGDRWAVMSSENGSSWEVADLPASVFGSNQIRLAVHGENAAVIADDESEASQTTVLLSSDRGTTWRSTEVAPNEERRWLAGLRWVDGEWLGAGEVPVNGQATAATFALDASDEWVATTVDFTSAEDSEDVVTWFRFIEHFEDGLIAMIGGNSANAGQTATSPDGVAWTIRPELFVQQFNSNDRVAAIAWDERSGRALVARSFATPMWFTSSGVGDARADGFGETILRGLVGTESVGEEFFSFVFEGDSNDTTIWRSADGVDWSLSETVENWSAKQVFGMGGVLVRGVEPNGDNGINVFRYLEGSRDYASRQLSLGPGVGRVGSSFATVYSTRTFADIVLAADITVAGETFPSISFEKALEGPRTTHRIADARPDSRIQALCPSTRDGSIAVIFRDEDGLGGGIDVWTRDGRVGAGSPVDGSFETAMFHDCTSALGVHRLTGAVCDGQEFAEDPAGYNGCEAAIWQSTDGLVWEMHPAIDQLRTAGIRLAGRAGHGGSGTSFVAGGPSSDSLWLVHTESIVKVPVDDTFVVGSSLRIDEVERGVESILMVSKNSLFIADLQELRDRALAEAPMLMASLMAQEIAAADILIEEARQSPPPTPAAAPPASPTQQAPPNSQAQPTAAPQAQATVAPAVPQCSPGDITTTGACRCSGGQLFDNGGQCILRCAGTQRPDGFGGCINSDGSTVETNPDAGGGTVGSEVSTTCTTVTDPETGRTTIICEVTGLLD